MAEKTIVNYDELAKIGKLFDKEAEDVAGIETQLRQKAQELESEWIGEGADKFFNEFFQDVLPAVSRVKQACVMTSQTIRVVAQIFDEAEEETTKYFKDGSLEDGGASGVGGGGGAGVDFAGMRPIPGGMGPGLNNAPGGAIGTQPSQEPVVVDPGSGPGGAQPGGSGIDVSEIDFGEDGFPSTGIGEEAGHKELNGQKPIPASQEQPAEKFFNEQAPAGGATGGGGGGSAGGGGSQGMQGGLEMGVGGHSQTSAGPGAAGPTGAGGGAGMQDHVYQQGGASSTPGTTAQSVPSQQGTTAGGTTPVDQSGIGAAGALGGAGAVGGAGAAAAKKLKENKDGE